MPPSAINGMLASREAFAQAMIAVICGMPTPLTTRVVQIDPGPMPTLMASAPAAIRSRAASSVAMFPTMRSRSGNLPLHFLDRFKHARRMTMSRVDGNDIHFRAHQFGCCVPENLRSLRSRRRRAAGPE